MATVAGPGEGYLTGFLAVQKTFRCQGVYCRAEVRGFDAPFEWIKVIQGAVLRKGKRDEGQIRQEAHFCSWDCVRETDLEMLVGTGDRDAERS